MTTQHDLILVRSDLGDGGWSLHRSVTDEDIAEGGGLLLSGDAERTEDGGWTRPNAQDYARALAALGGAS